MLFFFQLKMCVSSAAFKKKNLTREGAWTDFRSFGVTLAKRPSSLLTNLEHGKDPQRPV